MLLEHIVADRKTETGAGSRTAPDGPLGGEERFEGPGDRRGIHSATGVRDPQQDVWPPGEAGQTRDIVRIQFYAERLDPDSSEVGASYELLVNLEEISGDPVRAWTGLINAMLRDPRMIYY